MWNITINGLYPISEATTKSKDIFEKTYFLAFFFIDAMPPDTYPQFDASNIFYFSHSYHFRSRTSTFSYKLSAFCIDSNCMTRGCMWLGIAFSQPIYNGEIFFFFLLVLLRRTAYPRAYQMFYIDFS